MTGWCHKVVTGCQVVSVERSGRGWRAWRALLWELHPLVSLLLSSHPGTG